jgi:hypothetical protein
MANEATIAALQQVADGYATAIATIDKTDLQTKLTAADDVLQDAQRKFNRLSSRMQQYSDWQRAREAALVEIERLAGRLA